MTLSAAALVPAPVYPLVSEAACVRILDEQARDHDAREALLDRAFGSARFEKTCERLREGREPARHLSLVAKEQDKLIGTLRFWHVKAGSVDALLLGPLAVDASARKAGLGGALIRMGLARASALGHKAVILVGDEPYYQRFGFSRALAERLDLPGWYEPSRFLGLELAPASLAEAQGMVVATGRFDEAGLSRAA